MTGKPSFERALLPLDLSKEARRVVHYAEMYKAMGVRRAYLLHVLDQSLLEHVIAGYDPHRLVEEHSREAVRRLEEVAEELREAGLEAEVLPVKAGHVARVIADTARELGVGLTIMTDRGQGFFRIKLLGSTVEEYANTCATPLLVVKTRFQERHVTKILLALSFADKELDRTLLAHAQFLHEKTGASITVLHVVEEGDEARAREVLGDTALAYSLGEPRLVVEKGRPYRVILEWVEKTRPDLLMIGNDECMGRDPGEHGVFQGSVSDILLKRSPVHVLVVPKP